MEVSWEGKNGKVKENKGGEGKGWIVEKTKRGR